MPRKDSVYVIKFMLIGALNTAVGYGVYVLLVQLGLSYVSSLVFSYITGIIHSYAWNRYWNFRSMSPLGIETVRFVSAYAASFCINLVILRTFIEGHSAQPFIAQAFAIVLTAPAAFLLMRYWVFQKNSVR